MFIKSIPNPVTSAKAQRINATKINHQLNQQLETHIYMYIDDGDISGTEIYVRLFIEQKTITYRMELK